MHPAAVDPLATVPEAVLPSRLRPSPLWHHGGFVILSDFPAPDALQFEAQAHVAHANVHETPTRGYEDNKGGNPARRFLSAPGGRVQDAIYHAPSTRARLEQLAGLPVQPSGARGTFTYYARPGDFLGLHRDIDACNLAVITCLEDTATGGRAGGLCLWPTRLAEPLSAIRADPAPGSLKPGLLPGQTLVFFGGVLPHLVLPTAPGQRRTVSILCYRV